MNDTSSRSHCVTVLTLSVLAGGGGGEALQFRQSRLQFFDLMGRWVLLQCEQTH